MSTFDDERLLILGRVQSGELTPQEGSLQIAMLKVKAQDGGGAAAPERPAAGSRPVTPNPLAIGLLLLVPFVVMGMILTVGMLMFMALPAYLAMSAWNGLVVTSSPGVAAIGFWQTLAGFVAFGFLWTVLRWRRKVRVFVAGGASGMPFAFGAARRGPPPPPAAGEGLNPGDAFREQ